MALIRTSLLATLLTLPLSAGSVALAKPAAAPGGSWSYSVEHTTRSKGRLGVQIVSISPELRTHFGAPKDAGLLVDRVVPASAAAKAGIKTGDVIVSLEGTAVASAGEMIRIVSRLKRDAKLRITLIRRGKKQKVVARIESQAALDPFADTGALRKNPFQGNPNGRFDRLREYRNPFPPSFESNDDLLRRIEELEKRMETMAKRLPPKRNKS